VSSKNDRAESFDIAGDQHHRLDLRLRAALSGQMMSPDDAGYDEARTDFHGGIDRRPAAIVRAKGATDGSRVVWLAGERAGARRP
jgi:hypothetical protein